MPSRCGVLNLTNGLFVSGGIYEENILNSVLEYNYQGIEINLPRLIHRRESHSVCALN